MDLSFRVTRALHDDHMAVIALLQTVSTALGGAGRQAEIMTTPETAPAPAPATTHVQIDSRLAGILVQLADAVEGEIGAHFALEEDGLFPLLAEAGAGDLGEMLSEEHAIILPLGRRVAALARDGGRNGFDAAGWREFRRLGLEFADLLTAHAEKEEMGLLPLLEEILYSDDDRRLADAYEAGLPIGPAAADDNHAPLAGEAAPREATPKEAAQ
jgi:hypothetical protein